MDTFNEAAELTERLNRDHNAELDEQLRLFADSRQKTTAFLQLADTIECDQFPVAHPLTSRALSTTGSSLMSSSAPGAGGRARSRLALLLSAHRRH